MSNLLEVTKKYLQVVNQQQPLHKMNPKEARSLRANTPKSELDFSKQLADITDKKIRVRDGEEIKIRIYTPKGNGPFPIIVYYHGGGWVLNSIETCDLSCQLIAIKTNTVVVSVEYRLAPEYKFPIPVLDAYDAFLWTVNNANKINGLRNEISVAGDSAGANLATVVTLINKNFKGPHIAAQFLLYPVTDLSYNSASYEEYEIGFGLEKKDMQWFGKYYIQDISDVDNPYVAPLKVTDARGLPQALIIVAENDILRDEGSAYANKLKHSGVHVQEIIAKGLVHSFFTKNDVFSEYIEQTIDQIDLFLSKYVKSVYFFEI